MKLYNFNDIKAKGDCIEFARHLGAEVGPDNRCAAVWRNGTRESSVVLTKDTWYDHGRQEGGGILDLCAIAKFGGTSNEALQQAQEYLGNYLNLPEVKLRQNPNVRKSRYDELIEDGYHEVCRYEYRNLEGETVHFVVRMEHPSKPKEFVQGTPKHWGVSDAELILYNLAAITESDWIVVVEGEKDADTLIRIGVPATTVCGGAKKWRHEYAEVFRDKNTIILPDNDDVGRQHAKMIAADLHETAGGIKIVQCSKLAKGDVTDYFQKEGGTWNSLLEMIQAAPEYVYTEPGPLERAKEANRQPFQNYVVEEREIGRRKIKEKNPRLINALVDDLHTRLLGAPFCVGDVMFDQDRDSRSINLFHRTDELFSWIAQKTNCKVDWCRNDGCVTKSEFFEALRAKAVKYEAISYVPDYPVRSDVFYAHPPIPPPSDAHRAFWEFVDFFNPADEVNRALIAAFVMSPLFYIPGVSKPMWIIDSLDGQGSGKSTLPELVAKLYGHGHLGGEVISVTPYELEKNYGEVVKRLISTSGRLGRIFLLDNVKGELKSSNLAQLVTASSISGRPSFGRGEESRPNNLTYVVTINAAAVDTDIASRAFFIMLRKPTPDATWKERIYSYIEKNRMLIFADIIDMLKNHRQFDILPKTRTPEFEVKVLQAACQSPAMFAQVSEFLEGTKAQANVDEDLARRIEETIRQNIMLVEVPQYSPVLDPENDRIFIRSDVIEMWLSGKTWMERKPIQAIRNYSKIGLLDRVSPKIMKYPHHGENRRHGIMWNYEQEKEVRIIGMNGTNKAKEVVEKT